MSLFNYVDLGAGLPFSQKFRCRTAYVDLSIGTCHFSAIRAYACRLVDLNGHAIIGRDVLNQCLVEFDGLLGEVRL
jgi:hypothetical protein